MQTLLPAILLLFICLSSFAGDYPKSFELLKLNPSEYEQKIQELILNKVDLNETNDEMANILTVAANEDKFELVSILLDYDVDPNLVGCRNRPTIVIAVSDQNYSLVEKLVSKGADINNRSCMNNDFPIVTAIYNNDYFMVKYLIEQGADLNQKDFDGFSVFMYLCRFKGGAELINLALKSNYVNLNYQEEYSGETALMWAVEKGILENVKTLLSYGVNLRARNKEGRRAIDIARKKNFKKIYRLLKLAYRQRD